MKREGVKRILWLAFACVFLFALPAQAKIPEPPHIIYGKVFVNGEMTTAGTVTVAHTGGGELLDSYVMGSVPDAGDYYLLQVPLDALDPQEPGTARPGDEVDLYVEEEWAGTTVVGERGSVTYLDLSACLPPGPEWYKDTDGDGYSDGTSVNACERPAGYRPASELTDLSGDCNDLDPAVHPGAEEVCNLVDDDCDGVLNEGCDVAISVTPDSWDFGTVNVGSSSVARAFAVSNSGSAAGAVNEVSLGGTHAGEYAIGQDGCTDTILGPGGGCEVQVSFAPSSDGVKDDAQLVVSISDPLNDPIAVPLSGTGDGDPDGDGVPYGTDNCNTVYNPGQEDSDDDGAGDACDACPGFDDAADIDLDGQPDACDPCPEDPDDLCDLTVEVCVYRSGAWLFHDYASGAPSRGVWTGYPGECLPVPIDYDGDGEWDFSQFCGGAWHFYNDEGSYLKGIWTGGVPGDLPVPADYDGDGIDEVVVFRGGAWLFYDFATGALVDGVWTGAPAHFTGGTPVPVPMDYDGDGADDFTVYSGGPWHFYNFDGTYYKGVWTGGVPEDIPVAADYDGDGTEDVVVFRGGAWLAHDLTTGFPSWSRWTGSPPHWHGDTSLPAPLDFDGDGAVDFTVYSGGPWHFYDDNGTYSKGIWTGGVEGDRPISRRLLP